MIKAIYIDAGHGLSADSSSPDKGANGIVSEREITVAVAKLVRAQLANQPAYKGIRIVSVGVDEDLSISQHQAAVNDDVKENAYTKEQSISVSIHCNAGKGTGTEAYYNASIKPSVQLVEFITQRISKNLGLKLRGRFPDTMSNLGKLAMVSGLNSTACLVELAFVDTAADAKLLQTKQAEFATSIIQGMCDHLMLSYVDPESITIFPDVEQGRWSEEAIKYCRDQGIMSGYPDGTFRPDRALSREEMATILFRIKA